jgi:hypothetical protein
MAGALVYETSRGEKKRPLIMRSIAAAAIDQKAQSLSNFYCTASITLSAHNNLVDVGREHPCDY